MTRVCRYIFASKTKKERIGGTQNYSFISFDKQTNKKNRIKNLKTNKKKNDKILSKIRSISIDGRVTIL